MIGGLGGIVIVDRGQVAVLVVDRGEVAAVVANRAVVVADRVTAAADDVKEAAVVVVNYISHFGSITIIAAIKVEHIITTTNLAIPIIASTFATITSVIHTSINTAVAIATKHFAVALVAYVITASLFSILI